MPSGWEFVRRCTGDVPEGGPPCPREAQYMACRTHDGLSWFACEEHAAALRERGGVQLDELEPWLRRVHEEAEQRALADDALARLQAEIARDRAARDRR